MHWAVIEGQWGLLRPNKTVQRGIHKDGQPFNSCPTRCSWISDDKSMLLIWCNHSCQAASKVRPCWSVYLCWYISCLQWKTWTTPPTGSFSQCNIQSSHGHGPWRQRLCCCEWGNLQEVNVLARGVGRVLQCMPSLKPCCRGHVCSELAASQIMLASQGHQVHFVTKLVGGLDEMNSCLTTW